MKLPLLIPVAFLLARLGAVTAQESTMTIPGDTDQTETLQTSPTPTDAGGSTSTGSATATQTNASQASPSALVAGPGEVIVAPKQGDLRMVPFNINVKQGDNITFIFGAGPHTVTRSSLLTICNASDAEGAFQSGRQDAGFRFPVQVKTNETQSYYCGVPGHCEKGMFGLINGLTVAVPGQGSFEQAIPDMAANNTELMSLWNETKSKCDELKQAKAWEWGNNLKTDQIAPWAMLSAMENILYTRQYFAENPSLLPSATASGTNPSSTGDSGSGAAHSIATSSISLALLVTFCILLIHQA